MGDRETGRKMGDRETGNMETEDSLSPIGRQGDGRRMTERRVNDAFSKCTEKKEIFFFFKI